MSLTTSNLPQLYKQGFTLHLQQPNKLGAIPCVIPPQVDMEEQKHLQPRSAPPTPNLYTRTLNNAVLTASLHYPGDAGCLTMCVMAKALHLTRPLSISACVSFSHTWFPRP